MANKADWIQVLENQCKKTSQKEVAQKLGYSHSVINQALSGKYPGDIEKLRQKVEGAFMGLIVVCPVIGEIPRNRCIDMQGRKFAATNPLRVQLYNSCPSCPHNCNRNEKENAA